MTVQRPRAPVGAWNEFVGVRLRRARIEKDVSQAQLADALGCTFQQVQKYENGKNRISTEKLLIVSKILDKPLGYFLDETINTPDQDAIDRLLGTPEGLSLMKAAVVLDKKAMKTLVNVAKAMNTEAGVA